VTAELQLMMMMMMMMIMIIIIIIIIISMVTGLSSGIRLAIYVTA